MGDCCYHSYFSASNVVKVDSLLLLDNLTLITVVTLNRLLCDFFI